MQQIVHGVVYDICPGAKLRWANLEYFNLRWANLQGADLCGASLYGVDLEGANLQKANLNGANLNGVNLTQANLRGANLYEAYLCGANFERANLREANLERADLYKANLEGAILPERLTLPEGNFTAYKKVYGGVVLELRIVGRRTSSLVGRKCRTDAAVVVRALFCGYNPHQTSYASMYDPAFTYTVGETVTEPKYSDDIRVECAPGIHFFVTPEEALVYST